MRTFSLLLLVAALPAVSSGCSAMAPRIYSPLKGQENEAERGDHALEIEALATELADRAESRSPLAGARIQLGALDAIEPRRSPYRQVSVLERDLRATEATVRHELSMSLGNRVNIVGHSAEIATHRIEGEFLRSASALELSLRLVEIKSDWIVATARRRIENFVPEFYDRRLPPVEPSPLPAPTGSTASRVESAPSGSSLGSPSELQGRARPLRPAYQSQDAGLKNPEAVAQVPQVPGGPQVPEPTTVLSAGKSLGADVEPRVDPELQRGTQAGSSAESPIEFESGPAAARLRATGILPPQPGSTGTQQD